MSEEIDLLHQDLVKYQSDVSLADAMRRLESNPDYIKVFSSNYFQTMAIELTEKLGEPENTQADVESIHKKLLGIGLVKNYINTIYSEGEQAQRSVDEIHSNLANIGE